MAVDGIHDADGVVGKGELPLPAHLLGDAAAIVIEPLGDVAAVARRGKVKDHRLLLLIHTLIVGGRIADGCGQNHDFLDQSGLPEVAGGQDRDFLDRPNPLAHHGSTKATDLPAGFSRGPPDLLANRSRKSQSRPGDPPRQANQSRKSRFRPRTTRPASPGHPPAQPSPLSRAPTGSGCPPMSGRPPHPRWPRTARRPASRPCQQGRRGRRRSRPAARRPRCRTGSRLCP